MLKTRKKRGATNNGASPVLRKSKVLGGNGLDLPRLYGKITARNNRGFIAQEKPKNNGFDLEGGNVEPEVFRRARTGFEKQNSGSGYGGAYRQPPKTAWGQPPKGAAPQVVADSVLTAWVQREAGQAKRNAPKPQINSARRHHEPKPQRTPRSSVSARVPKGREKKKNRRSYAAVVGARDTDSESTTSSVRNQVRELMSNHLGGFETASTTETDSSYGSDISRWSSGGSSIDSKAGRVEARALEGFKDTFRTILQQQGLTETGLLKPEPEMVAKFEKYRHVDTYRKKVKEQKQVGNRGKRIALPRLSPDEQAIFNAQSDRRTKMPERLKLSVAEEGLYNAYKVFSGQETFKLLSEGSGTANLSGEFIKDCARRTDLMRACWEEVKEALREYANSDILENIRTDLEGEFGKLKIKRDARDIYAAVKGRIVEQLTNLGDAAQHRLKRELGGFIGHVTSMFEAIEAPDKEGILSGITDELLRAQIQLKNDIRREISSRQKYNTYLNERVDVIAKAINPPDGELSSDVHFDQLAAKLPDYILDAYGDYYLTYIQFDHRIRRSIYTTNSIESINAKIKKATRNKLSFENPQYLLDYLFVVIQEYQNNKWMVFPVSLFKFL